MSRNKNIYKANKSFSSKSKKKKNIYSRSFSSVTNFGKKIAGFFSDERLHKSVGLIFLLIGFYLFLSFTSYLFTWKNDYSLVNDQSFSFVFSSEEIIIKNWLGKLGAFTAHKFLKVWFGISSYFFCYISLLVGARILFKFKLISIVKSFKVSFLGLIWISMTAGFIFQYTNYDFLGGLYGLSIANWLTGIGGVIGAGFFILFSGFVSIVLLFNPSFKWLEKIIDQKNNEEFLDENEFTPVNTITKDDVITEVVQTPIDLNNEDDDDENEITSIEKEFELKEKEIESTKKPIETEAKEQSTKDENFSVEVGKEENKLSDDEISDKVKEFGEFDPKLELSQYQLPNIDLLEGHGDGNIIVNKEELEGNKNKIIETLNNYKISISKIKATIGPTVTLYEIVPAAGVRISKIKNLEDDIALSLSALGIRIIAPMPGKGTVGIEVPNSKPDIVSMRALIASDRFQNSELELPVALGKTISNESLITDLTKMPHLLMAGATGQGKSVGLNAILVSILYKKHPSQVKFVLIDPKKVELTIYNKIERHFLAKLPDEEEAIITDTKKVVNTLNSLCVEMEARYELLKNAMVRTIKEYNQKFINRKLNPEKGHRYLPYIVLVVDEFADLIMTAGKEIETPVARIAQLARAIGIHLIIATQRPSVNVITGTIKANFPARIAFRVTSKIDSRTILDAGGADQLIGRGDMLYSSGSEIIRLQCGFVDTPEVDAINEFIGSQRGYPSALLLPEYIDEANEIKEIDDDLDSLFEDAAEIIVMNQQGSASLIQRKLKLGYNRAGRIVDQLEALGVVGPSRGSKAREVLIPDSLALEQFLNDLREQGKLK
ncbi:MAG: DNA translocase FtsK 4TM domain-containing protein [Bacteroidota bacterium]|nr:DNA translocase FtsK 4TM domain-containing protein [Bacteroidota bacterium]